MLLVLRDTKPVQCLVFERCSSTWRQYAPAKHAYATQGMASNGALLHGNLSSVLRAGGNVLSAAESSLGHLL